MENIAKFCLRTLFLHRTFAVSSIRLFCYPAQVMDSKPLFVPHTIEIYGEGVNVKEVGA